MPEDWRYDDPEYGRRVQKAIDKTGGVTLTFDFGPTTRDVHNHICSCAAPPITEYQAIVPVGWKTIKLKGILDPDNGIDTDEDGLTDWDEVDTYRLTWGSDGSVTLPTIEECIDFEEKPYAEDGLARFKSDHWVSGMPYSAFEQYIAYVLSSTHVLPIFSDPTCEDSDGDGYDDYSECYKHSSNPLLCDIKTIELRNPYTRIDTSSDSSLENYNYGGRQGWFYDKNNSSKNDIESRHISGGGCGIIASCDVILYLQKTRKKKLTEVDTESSAVAFNEYERFIRLYAKDYLTPLDVETSILNEVTKENTKVKRPLFTTPLEDMWYDSLDEFNYNITRGLMNELSNAVTNNTGTWGCDPYSLQAALKKYCSDNGFNTDIDFCLACSVDSQESLEKQIFKSISNNIPAIMMIGLTEKTEYRYEWDATPTESVDSHFVVITGIHIDNIAQKATLTVSTWSRKAYIELDNFLDHPGILGGIVFIQT